MPITVISNHPALGGEVTKPLPPLPTTSIPPPKPIAQQGLLMRAAAVGKPVVTVDSVRLENVTASSDSTTSPGGFMAKGTISLFGNKDVTAELDIWNGPPPPGVTVGSAAPSIQRAIVKGSVGLSQLIPALSQTSLGADLSLQNVSIYRQNYLYDPTKGLGYNLDADLVIDSSLGLLPYILSKDLAVNEPTVHIHADLGPNQSWDGAVNIQTLTIEGSFIGHTYAVTSGVQFTTIGARLFLAPGTRDAEVFGTLNLTLPSGGPLPLELDYTLKIVGETWQLVASLPSGVTWVNPLGVQGFALNPVTFSSSLPLSNPWKGLTLDIAAKFQYQATVVNFTGSYGPSGACTLDASIRSFDLSSLQQLYEAVQHEPLKAPGVDVTIDSVDLTISSAKGFSASLTNVNIAGYGSGNAELSLSSAGSVIHANLGTVQFGDLTVNSAFIKLDLKPASSSQPSDAFIYGDLKFEAVEATVAVHIYSSASSVVPKRTEWTVFAELSSSDNSLALSKIEPRVKGTEFDLALKNVVLIAASQDDPDVSAVIMSACKPKQGESITALIGARARRARAGVQFFAAFDGIHIFNSLAQSNVTDLVLDAAWSRATGFSLNVMLLSSKNLRLGKGITTTPVTLTLDLTPSPIDKTKWIPSLSVSAGLYIPVAKSPAPLLFQMTLTAMDTDATITAQLDGNWVDPFGISDEVVIGPLLLLQGDFDYVTGLQGILFKGGLAVGKVTANVAVSVNEDPLKELLCAEVDNLNLTDVVSFAEKLLRLKLHPPPANFLEFDTVKLYICPAPLVVNGVLYPTGFSFEANMILFGKHVDVSCDVNSTSLSISGNVDDFNIGPLKLTGLDGAKQAALQVQVNKDIQHLYIDGAVTLYAETYALHLLVNTQPFPEVSFKIEFKLTELLTLEVDATLIGQLNFKDLSKADFNFNADLEQHLLDWVHDEVLKLFGITNQAANNGVDAAKKQLDKEQLTNDQEIASATNAVEVAQKIWENHRDSVIAKSQGFIQGYNAQIQRLEGGVVQAEGPYDKVLQKAQTALADAQYNRTVKIQAAEFNLEKAKSKASSDIEAAKRNVSIADTNMKRGFGSAEDNIDKASRTVQAIQGQINDLDRVIANVPLLLKKGLETKKAALEAQLHVAQGVLDAVNAVLKSPKYALEKAALSAAQTNLDQAERAALTTISDSQKALASVDQGTQDVVNKASNALKDVQKGSEKILLDGAVEALALYKKTNDPLFEAAKKAIADLTQSVEYIVFSVATTRLAKAKDDGQSLKVLQGVLAAHGTGGSGTAVSGIEKDLLGIGKAIVDEGAKAFNITSIHLSGSLGKSVGGAGFMAAVKGVALKKSFEISVELNPSKVENFLKDVFQALKADLKKHLHI